jgi:hypothetical protein
MMKRTLPLLLCVCCLSIVRAGYDDGLISTGEYEEAVDWLSGTLVVDGGGANVIEVWDFARLEVRSTTPFQGQGGGGGITDIDLLKYSRLDYYGGEAEELTIRMNAKAYLYGGRIDGISSFQYATTKHVFIYAREGWSWNYENGKIRGITGSWYDGSPFSIRFTTLGEGFGADAVWMNVKVITPEPATLLLFVLGGLLIRREL